jgi:hypothetical protein
MHLEERRVLPGEVLLYKVVGNENDLTEYNAKKIVDVASRCSTANWETDWTAMYTQFKQSHALGTVPYRWEQEDASGNPYMVASLVEVHLREPLDVVVAAGQTFWDSAVDGLAKAHIVKEHLGIPATNGLMSSLGQQRKALLMQETEDEWELIFCHKHLASLQHEDRTVASFERAATFPVTSHWRANADGVRRRYDTDNCCLDVLQELGVKSNEEPAWLTALQELVRK